MSNLVISEPLESLGDSITSAVLLSWNKQPGDSVKEDEVIAVVETDKVRTVVFHCWFLLFDDCKATHNSFTLFAEFEIAHSPRVKWFMLCF